MSWPAGSPGDAAVAWLIARWPARSARRAGSVLGLLGTFGAAAGWPATAESLLDYDLIEGFCVRGCAAAAPATRGTYRSVLYALAATVHGPPGQRPAPQPGAKAPPPYSRAERADLAAMAAAQNSPAKRSSALAMIWCGTGAGLRPGELAALRGTDIRQSGRRVIVCAGQGARREVPVAAPYAAAVAGLARQAGDGFVFRPGPADRGYHDFVNGFARRLAADPGGPRLSAGRCRASFICDHLAAGTPVGVLLAITGIAEAGSLARYARHVAGISSSKGALRARWRAEARP
jgi:integrase